MDDILLIQLLKKKGIITDRDMHEFHEVTTASLEPVYLDKQYENMHITKTFRHMNEEESKELVSKMYHIEDGRKYMGYIPTSVTYCDIYIVINSHYHDYISLYKQWFGDKADCKIIESAMVFWFMDDDYEYENKVQKFYM